MIAFILQDTGIAKLVKASSTQWSKQLVIIQTNRPIVGDTDHVKARPAPDEQTISKMDVVETKKQSCGCFSLGRYLKCRAHRLEVRPN